MGFPGGSAGKESAFNAEDLGSIPWLGRTPGEGKGYPLQYSGLENSMDCTDLNLKWLMLTILLVNDNSNRQVCQGLYNTTMS